MSRDADFTVLRSRIAAASAATVNMFYGLPARFKFVGFEWNYETTEANADNTIDFVITRDQDKDGTHDATGDTIHTNANTCGLLDSAAVGQFRFNRGNAASAAGAAVAVTPTAVDIDDGETIRVAMTTAGTGTVPAINFNIVGYWLTGPTGI